MSENATTYEMAWQAYSLIRSLVDAGTMPATHLAAARDLLGAYDTFSAAHRLLDCETCDARGVTSGWVKCDGTGAEENLDYPCACPAGQMLVAELQGRGMGWVL